MIVLLYQWERHPLAGQTTNTMLVRHPKGKAMNRSKRHNPIRNTHTDRKCRAAIREAIARRELRTMGA